MAPYTGFSKGRGLESRLLDELEEELEMILPVVPGPVALPQPADLSPTHSGLDITALLQAVQGGDEEVTSLSLKLLVQDSSLQRVGLSMPALRHLTLDGSQLTSLRDLGTGMSQLRVLRVTRCSLISLDGISGLASLRELHAAHNQVADIWSCSVLARIKYIDLSFSAVCNASQAGFLAPCSRLRALSLQGSPAAISGNAAAYRAEIRRQLPELLTLDGQDLTPTVQLPPVLGVSDEPSGISSGKSSRPLSAASAMTPVSLSARETTRDRPSSAASTRDHDAGEEAAASSSGVSSLASALRSVRVPVHCWSTGGDSSTVPQDNLLEAARQWRKDSQSFRQQTQDADDEEQETRDEL